MLNDFSSGFRDSAPSADSELKVSISYEHSEQRSLVVDKKLRASEPMRIGEVLPAVMRDIEKRMQRSAMWMHEQLDSNQPNVLK